MRLGFKLDTTSINGEIPFVFSFTLVFMLAYFVLQQGIYGPFILDDLLHFPRLSNGVYTSDEAIKWIFSGGESGSGRFLSYASFLIDDNIWPNKPEIFKHTNLLLHLLSGIMVYLLLRQIICLVSFVESKRSVEFIALLLTFFWMFAPMQHSAIYMAIQRMTILMGLFVLIGLNLYVYGRIKLQDSALLGYFYMSLGIGFFGVLSVFSKEPGILICLYALVLEYTILKDIAWENRFKDLWKSIFLIAPLISLLAFYILSLSSLEEHYAKREFSFLERLISEPRALVKYIYVFLYPHGAFLGPYQDDFQISRHLFLPVSTFFSIGFSCTLMLFALKFNKLFPLKSAGILFFFSAHLLESTILPLELYFEHRNYIGSIGILLAVFGLICLVKERILDRYKKYIYIILTFIATFHVYSAYSSAKVWGSESKQALVWAYYHPKSVRAQIDSVKYWLNIGNIEKARQILVTSQKNDNKYIGVSLFAHALDICGQFQGVKFFIGDDVEKVLRNSPFDHGALDAISVIRRGYLSGNCNISNEQLQSYILSIIQNKNFSNVNSAVVVLYQELTGLQVDMNDRLGALESMEYAYLQKPYYSIALAQANIAFKLGDAELVERYLARAEYSPRINVFDFLWRKKEIKYWREVLQ